MKYLFVFLTLFAQHASAQLDSIIQRVPGTRVCLRVPKGFQRSSSESAFFNPDQRASIHVMESLSPFSGAVAMFNPTRLQNDGLEVLLRDTIDFNGIQGFRLKLKTGREQEYIRNILLFGDENYVVMVDGYYPDTSKLEQTIENSLLTAIYHKTFELDRQERLKFTVSPESEGFTFMSTYAGELTYIITDSTRDPSANDPSFAVWSRKNLELIPDFRKRAVEVFSTISKRNEQAITSIEKVVVDKMDGYEITARDTAKQELFYQMILFPGANSFFMMWGSARNQNESFFAKYRAIARTFRRK